MFTHLPGYPFVLWFHTSGSLLPAWPGQSAQCSAWGQRGQGALLPKQVPVAPGAVGCMDRAASTVFGSSFMFQILEIFLKFYFKRRDMFPADNSVILQEALL